MPQAFIPNGIEAVTPGERIGQRPVETIVSVDRGMPEQPDATKQEERRVPIDTRIRQSQPLNRIVSVGPWEGRSIPGTTDVMNCQSTTYKPGAENEAHIAQ